MIQKIIVTTAIFIASHFALSAQTITVIKKAGTNKNKSHSIRNTNKHIYTLYCPSVPDSLCHWQHASEKINGYLPIEVNNWVMQEIKTGKNKGKTMYQSSVYVKWHARKNKHTIKMSSKVL